MLVRDVGGDVGDCLVGGRYVRELGGERNDGDANNASVTEVTVLSKPYCNNCNGNFYLFLF